MSFDSLQDNTWGYTAAEGAVIPEGATYKAVATGQGNAIYTNNNSRVKDEKKTFALGFAAKIDNSMPADTYENQVTLSVVSSPYQLTLMDIDNMQDMTSAICENSPQLSTKQLKDIRDGKYYWVTKLADNNCWMTQNLDLDITTADGTINDKDNAAPVEGVWPDATLSDYDEVPMTPVYVTSTMANVETINGSSTSTYSWSLGDMRIIDPAESNGCGDLKNNALQCAERFTVYNTPISRNGDVEAHYILGNHYQWNTATAGSGGAMMEGQATSSICPKGWRLPNAGNFVGLISTGSIGGDAGKLALGPYSFVRSGYVAQTAKYLLSDLGVGGYYWSSTASTNDSFGTVALSLIFSGSDTVTPFANHTGYNFGFSVRCIAR